MAKSDKIENVNHPGKTTRVDPDKYEAMKRALLQALPSSPPGLTTEALREAVLANLPEALFPQGATAGWWRKGVQLDLEAKGIIARDSGKPLRLYKL